VEIEGKCLNVYGQTAIKFLDRPWNPQKAAEVQTVKWVSQIFYDFTFYEIFIFLGLLI